MSFNQSKSDKNESQFRKPGGGRSGGTAPQRNFTGGSGKGGGGGSTAPSLSQQLPSAPGSRSFKKPNHAHGGQHRVTSGLVHTPESRTTIQNGAHAQPTLQGARDAPVPNPAINSKPADEVQGSSKLIPKAPSSRPSTDSRDSTTPVRGGDGGRGFSLQFGSISPGFMNGMQVPARTTSAPPNLDEQKRDLARHEASRAAPAIPIPSGPKPQLPKKAGPPSTVHPSTGEGNPETKLRRDATHLSSGSIAASTPTSQQQKPAVLPMGGTMPLPFPHQSVQFGGPSPQIPSHGMTSSSLPMPMQMPMPMGNSSVQPVFIPGFQSHLMQPQGLMHQGPSLGFSPPMGPQLSHQLGGSGMNVPPQFSPQQPLKYGSARKVVKITHPETHEELRLDKKIADGGGSTVSRPHSGVPSQSQTITGYNSHHAANYYSNTFTGGPSVFSQSSSHPLTNAQLSTPTQTSRFNYSVSQSSHTVPLVNQSASNVLATNHSINGGIPHCSVESSNADSTRDVLSSVVTVPSTQTQVTIKHPVSSVESKAFEKVEPPKVSRLSGQSSSSQINKDSQMTEGSTMQLPKLGVEQLKPLNLPGDERSSAGEMPSSTLAAPLTKSPTANQGTAARPGCTRENLKANDPLSLQVTEEAASVSHHTSGSIEASDCTESGNYHSIVSKALGNSSKTSGDLQQPTAVTGVLESNASSISSDFVGAGNDFKTTGNHSTSHSDGRTLRAEEHTGKDVSKPVENGTVSTDSPGTSIATTDKNDRNSGPVVGSHEIGSLDTSHHVVHSPTSKVVGKEFHGETAASDLSTASDGENVLILDGSLKASESMGGNESFVSAIPVKIATESSKHEEGMESSRPASSSGSRPSSSSGSRPSSSSGSRPTSSSGSVTSSSKVSFESIRSKSSLTRGKKKRKEIFQKADALGTTSDLYTAYKGPEEKKETGNMSESVGNTLNSESKPVSTADPTEEKDERSKGELDDWEDAAEISTPKLEPSGNAGRGLATHHGEDMGMTKKYSRDFLLTFSEPCTDLPLGFEITSYIADIVIHPTVASGRVAEGEYPSPGRIIDRAPGGPRVDRWGSGMADVGDRRGKLPGQFLTGREMGRDPVYGSNMMGFRPGQGNTHGVLRTPRAQAPVPNPILSGPMQQSVQRNNSDADRWRNINFKGLMPPPQAPLMHRADRKYEVGKTTDEEEGKQRRLKGILNKLTPQNFEKLFIQVKEVNIDNAVTLTGVISQIFDKALMEPTFCEMYADFCSHLAADLPELTVDDQKITFKRLLLNKCQEEFEREEREEEEANNTDNNSESVLSEGEREEKRLKARRRMLGNIRLIGELYKKRMLTERIMHECIKKLFGQYGNPDEENIEALCKLMSTIGKMIDHPKAKEHMDAYFSMMTELSNNMKLSSRVRFMLRDAIDLRKNEWEQRRKIEGPKKIEEVHRDAVQERQAQTSKLSRGPSMNSSMRRGQPMDFGPRGSMMSSPMGHVGSFRGLSSQARTFAMQDVRNEDRSAFENRISVPLPQRPLGDDSITLGPQGGLARGMSVRGQPSVSTMPVTDMSLSHGDIRRTSGLNGFSSVPDRAPDSSREDHLPRYNPERFGGPLAYDQPSTHYHSSASMSRDLRNVDRSADRPVVGSLPMKDKVMSAAPNVSSVKVWPEEHLRDMSLAAIREYYSAKDDQEVSLCVKDLNAPGFYPSVISIWVSDSFERKDLERDLLAKLIVKLSNPQSGLFIPSQLIKGFESVLANLEDTVNDAPRAPEYLGRLFAKVISENIVSLREVGRLLYEGGEQPGALREAGLAGDVLGSVLEAVRSEKGEAAIEELRASSNIRLEDFRPPEPLKSRKLELFI